MNDKEDSSKVTSTDKTASTGVDYKVFDKQIFEDAAGNIEELITTLTENKKLIAESVKTLCNPEVFCGSVATSCQEALDELESRLQFSVENYTNMKSYFAKVADAYDKGDKNAQNILLSLGDDGKVAITTVDPLVQEMIDMAKGIATNNKYGYVPGGYGGSGFDCGGLVWYVLNNTYGLNYDTSQGISPYMLASQLPKYGFEKINVSGPVNQSQLKPGDILINPSIEHGHTAIYIGDGKILEARWNYDSKAGDSSGNEISINSYNSRIYKSGNYNFNYNTIIRTSNRNMVTSV